MIATRLAHLVEYRVDRPQGAAPYLALEHLEGWTGRLFSGVALEETEPSAAGQAAVRKGDVLFGKLRPYLAKSYLVERSLLASTELICLRPAGHIDSRWLGYLVRSNPFVEWSVATSAGTKMPRTSWEKLRDYRVRVPTVEEQRAIADYLDRDTTRIDALIGKKLQFIELLEKRFDAMVRDTVSGIGDAVRPPWLPAMASDRRLVRLGSVLELRREKNSPVTIRQVLSLTADRGVILYEEKGNIGNKASEDISRYSIVRVGDIVMNSMNVIIGSVGLSKYEGVLSPVYYVMRPIDDALVDRRFLAYHFRIREFQRQLVRLGYGILDHRMRIPWANLKTQEMVLPPHKIQTEVADVLEEAESTFRSTLGKVKTSVELLRERRQALITAAVAGELLVPEVAV